MIQYDELLLAACVQDIAVLRKVDRLGFNKYFFNGKSDQYLYSVLRRLSQYNYYDAESIKTFIAEDRLLTDSERNSYVSEVDHAMSRDVSNLDLAVDILKKKVFDKEMRKLVDKAARNILQKEDPAPVYQEMSDLNNRFAISESGHEKFDLLEGWQARKEERIASLEDDSRSLRFSGSLSPFARYFTRGLSKGEITAIGGPTYAGKSILLSNFIHMAIHPSNGLNVVYVFAENRPIQSLSRLDSIILDRDYDGLFIQENDPRGDKFFQSAREEGWGNVMAFKVTPGHFSTGDMSAMLEECRLEGFHPDIIAIDSPDHQMPLKISRNRHENKGEVYWDIKAMVEKEDLIALTSLPMKPSSVKATSVTSEDVAGSYDISRIVDNLILFNVNPDDAVLGKISLQIPKLRDGKTDKANIEFRVRDSLRVQPWAEFERQAREVAYIPVNGESVQTKFIKKSL